MIAWSRVAAVVSIVVILRQGANEKPSGSLRAPGRRITRSDRWLLGCSVPSGGGGASAPGDVANSRGPGGRAHSVPESLHAEFGGHHREIVTSHREKTL